MSEPITNGSHHIGLTVSHLEANAEFFTSLLGWNEVPRNDEYPAIFLSDGKIMLTLWAVKDQPAIPLIENQMSVFIIWPSA